MLAESTQPAVASPPRLAASVGKRLMALATPAHYISLVVAGAFILYVDRGGWFFQDELEFFARMQPGHSLALLTPHAQNQWSTIPLLLVLALYKLVGLRSILPYNLLLVLVHLAVAHLLWRWMRRIGADTWAATALAAVFLVAGGGAEDFATWFQVTFTLSVAFGLLGAFVVDHDAPSVRRDLIFWPIAIAGLMCSDVGVFMVVLGGLVALLRRGPVAAARVVSVPAAVFLAWIVLFAHGAPSTTPATPGQLLLIPQYAWTGITAAINDTTGWSDTGGALVLVLGVWLYSIRRLAVGPQAFAFAGALLVPLFFASIGVGRVASGVQEAGATRYGYVCIALLLPAVALAVTRVCRLSAVFGRSLLVAVSGAWVVNGVASLLGLLTFLMPLGTAVENAALGDAQLLTSGAPLAVGEGANATPWAPNLTVGMLRSMIHDGALPTDVPVTSSDLLVASEYLQVSITSTRLIPSGAAATVLPEYQPLVIPDGEGCVSLAPFGGQPDQVGLAFASAASVEVIAAPSGSVSAQLAWSDDPSALTAARVLTIPDDPAYLNDTAPGTIVMLTLPAGTDRLCGVAMTAPTVTSHLAVQHVG